MKMMTNNSVRFCLLLQLFSARAFVPLNRGVKRNVQYLHAKPTTTKEESEEDDIINSDNDHHHESLSRRNILLSPLISFATTTTLFSGTARPANAELVQFPCKDGLMNTYHFMRAGESLLEEQNILSTNPLFLTNRVDNSLSVTGTEQVHRACQYMESNHINPSVVKFSLAANAMDTANIIATENFIGRNRLVPEYTYMDQRAIGRWDMLPLQSTQDAVWAMDSMEAGKEGLGGRPPPHNDGTPNETLSNQVTRLRQLISLLESMMSGDSILLIFPDGTGPAVLSCLIAGIPLDRVHELSFNPGEVRLDINYDSVNSMVSSSPSESYVAAIQRGKEQLKLLREQDPEQILNVKEQIYEAEVKAEEAIIAREKAKAEMAKEAARKVKAEEAIIAREKAKAEKEAFIRKKDVAVRKEGRKDLGVSKEVGNSVTGSESTLPYLGTLGLATGLVSWTYTKEATTQSHLGTEEQSNNNTEYAELSKMENLIEDSPIMIPEFSPTEASTNSTTSDDGPVYSELKEMEEKIKSAPVIIPELTYEEKKLKDEKDKMLIAEKAMQDYLDQDDGGEAWLEMLSELANDNED